MSFEHTNLSELPLMELGNTLQLSGVIYAGKDRGVLVCMFPEEHFEDRDLTILDLTQEEWEKVLRQTDLMETEIITRSPDGTLAKAMIRKSTRHIEQGVSWNVYRRDGYRCRYCGKDNVPLTVDHLVCWEHGGPSTEANLVACCRKCNKMRGQTKYGDWLKDPYYKKVSKDLLTLDELDANEQLLDTLADIQLRVHEHGR
jgi:5-methylcytosine-specific restriction endonuclease McrA